MDSTEIVVCGQQENSANSGHFNSTCRHPFLLFNRGGGAAWRPTRGPLTYTAPPQGRALLMRSAPESGRWSILAVSGENQMKFRITQFNSADLSVILRSC